MLSPQDSQLLFARGLLDGNPHEDELTMVSCGGGVSGVPALSSGTNFLQLRAGGQTVNRKITLVKQAAAGQYFVLIVSDELSRLRSQNHTDKMKDPTRT